MGLNKGERCHFRTSVTFLGSQHIIAVEGSNME